MMKNSQGKIFYGMHFYPGVAEYQEPGKRPYRVFLNEATIRSMDPTMAGRPVFVQHVDEVEQDIDVLRSEADGWVIESFYNQADGKHWAKFIVVSEKGERAIKQGMALSNCYVPKSFGSGGTWNGIDFEKEIKGGEYEHLAIVSNPRYEESVILTPEQFKKHNEENLVELKRLSNNNARRGSIMKFFKRAKVDNAADIEELSVVLPKSGREVSIAQLINDADRAYQTTKNDDSSSSSSSSGSSSGSAPKLDPGGVASIKKAFGNEEGEKDKSMAHPEHWVKMKDGSMCNVSDLLDRHEKMKDELEEMKKKKEDSVADKKPEGADEEGDPSHGDVSMKGKDVLNDESAKDHDAEKKNGEDEDAKKSALKIAEHEDKEIEAAKRKNAADKAARLRNADKVPVEVARIDLSMDQVARGKQRYGSGK
jgi:hypothetical protein